jgi:Domain of unknown function (DUF4157)
VTSKGTRATNAAQRSSRRAPQRHGKLGAAPVQAEDRRIVRELLRGHGSTVQAKVKVGEPDDEREREADRVADRIMRSPASGGPVPSPHTVLEDAEARLDAVQGGRPPSAAERAFFEPRLGRDLGDVRLHTGPAADQAARAVGALAYTRGRDVVFRDGAYTPQTDAGQRLLAHELVHVMQQAGPAAVSPELQRKPDPRLEPLLARLRAQGGTVGGAATDEQVAQILSTVDVDLSDPDNLLPVSQVVSAAFSNEVLLAFLQRVESSTPPRSQRGPDPLAGMRLGGHPHLGPNAGGGLFPYLGATASAVTHTAAAVARASGAFIEGLLTGLRGQLSEPELEAFGRRLAGTAVLNTVLPVPFLAGAAVGIGRDVVGAIKGAVEIIGNFSEVMQEFLQLIDALLTDPEMARALGQETGQQLGRRLVAMASESIIVFAYHLGEMIGPAIVYTALAVLGVAELAGAALLTRLGSVLRRFPRTAALLDKLALRLRRRGGHAPEAPDAPQHTGAPDAPGPVEAPNVSGKALTPQQRQALTTLEARKRFVTDLYEQKAAAQEELAALRAKPIKAAEDVAEIRELERELLRLDPEALPIAKRAPGKGKIAEAEADLAQAELDAAKSSLTLYERLRAAVPSDKARERTLNGATVDRVGPLKTKPTPLEADHVVSVREIADMDGFAELPWNEQKAIVDMKDNLIAMDGAANRSKGRRPWKSWPQASNFYDEPTISTMMKREVEIRAQIQALIKERLAKRTSGTP